MKGFWKRLKFYLIGFTVGLIFVFFFFKNRGCAWTPQNRVKNAIIDKVLVIPESEKKDHPELESLTSASIMQFLAQGDVNFGESLKDQDVYPKAYVVELEDSIPGRLQFSLYNDSYVSVIHWLDEGEKARRIEKPEGYGDFLRLPKDSAVVFVDKSNFVQCKARGLASKDQDDLVEALQATGRINFDKSDLMLTKAEQFIEFKQNDTIHVEAKTIWYESRITFKDFIWDYKLPCEK
tara:strand:- start:83495 stop:84202 length:708 start_codon:yes stop_codon:yes gene_type:complete